MKNKVLMVFSVILLVFSISTAKEKTNQFIISFGDGGLDKYKIVDNICFTYVFPFSDKPKEVSKNMNDVVMFVIQTIRQKYSKNSNGFINMKTNWQVAPDNRRIIYQICGDLIKAK